MNRLLTLLLSILTIFCVQAQNPFGNQDNEVPPVKWTGTARLTSPTEGVITLTASMSDGWHLYGVDMPENGPKPTRFKFEVAKGLELIGKLTAGSKPLTKANPMFNIDVNYWEGKVVFTQKFRLHPDQAPVNSIACSVTYMGCNDATCLPPQTKEFKLRILPQKK